MKRRSSIIIASLLLILLLLFGLGNNRRALLFPVHTTEAQTSSLTITAPLPNSTVSGTQNFTASASADIVSVEYWIGSFRIGKASGSPFTVTWYTAFNGDGTNELEAYGYDAAGNLKASTNEIVTFHNYGASANITSPNLSKRLSGTVTVTAIAYEPVYYPSYWLFFIDGNQVAMACTDTSKQHSKSVSVDVDTTQFSNGIHELFVAVHDRDPVGSGGYAYPSYRKGTDYLIDIENGVVLNDIKPSLLHVYLPYGGTVTLGCSQIFSDNSTSACTSPSYSSSETSVATVNPSTGLITGQSKQGFTRITVIANGKTRYTYVWVLTDPSKLPTLTSDGTWVTAIFATPIAEIEGSADEQVGLNAARVNALSQGFFPNPYNTTATLSSFKTTFDANYMPYFNWAASHGFKLLLHGDSIDRTCTDALSVQNWPSGQAAVQYAFSRVQATGAVLGVELVDEVDMMWGDTPLPGSDWCSGKLSKTFFSTLKSWISTASTPAIPVTWPPRGIATLAAYSNWTGTGTNLADYASHYHDTLQYRHTYPWSAGVAERTYYITSKFYERQPYLNLSHPQIMLSSVMGPYYKKKTIGGTFYHPPQDVIIAPGDLGPTLSASIMTEAAVGNTAVRLYEWEPYPTIERANAALGTVLQTGVNPVITDPLVSRDWTAISNTVSVIVNNLNSLINAKPINSPGARRNIITGARQALDGNSRLLLIVNGNDYTQQVPVDFTPYLYGGGPITRYLIGPYGTTTTSLSPNTTGETITLSGGQSVAYVFTWRAVR